MGQGKTDFDLDTQLFACFSKTHNHTRTRATIDELAPFAQAGDIIGLGAAGNEDGFPRAAAFYKPDDLRKLTCRLLHSVRIQRPVQLRPLRRLPAFHNPCRRDRSALVNPRSGIRPEPHAHRPRHFGAVRARAPQAAGREGRLCHRMPAVERPAWRVWSGRGCAVEGISRRWHQVLAQYG